MRDEGRGKDRDFLGWYRNPQLNNAIRKYSACLRNIEDREDAEQDTWADILALAPVDVMEAKRIAKRAIQRAWRRSRTTEEHEAGIDPDRLTL